MEESVRDKYEAVIGLEVHCQLATKSKIFAGDLAEYGHLPNTNISVITLGHPGTLPKLNKKVVEYAIKMGLACECEITRENYFDRKNYFYPDLPKGYQVTQDKTPICKGGFINIKTKSGVERQIGITKIHMEEDAGKSIHLDGETDTLVDYNRAGVPLIELVTEPEIKSSEEAYAFVTEVRKLVRYLEICDGNMEEGSMRCDANISIMPKGSKVFGKKVEVKNMNSIRNVQRAIEVEIERQIQEVEQGNSVVSETRTYDANRNMTYGMRVKEELNDYRYFPEPDLSPLRISEEYLKSIKDSMPSLPHELYNKFVDQYKLPEYDAMVLTDSKEIALFFEELCTCTDNYKAASNWVMGPVKSSLNELQLLVSNFPIKCAKLADLIQMVEDGKVSYSVASQKVYPQLLMHPDKTPLGIAEELNLIQESDTDSLQLIIDEVVAGFPEKVKDYKSGKKALFGMFMGEVMKKTQGKADPKVTSKLLSETLAR
ncbi:MAG TPA: Asp-tRNA(Asn)/Glu-tRNA(Gln) amidotransferase subunit GatB [Cytophagales bacterium]|nr:Asp-tRNA(Asn)/Glu-tRNA(Gln) amidotransferase subunit GatB [Cytophagales bacterium]